jgi:hypothetical protein
MREIIITEKQLVKLLEVAMDLDIYVQPVHYDTSNGNENLESSIKEMISKLNEIHQMFETGKKIFPDQKTELFKVLDSLNQIYEKIKYIK